MTIKGLYEKLGIDQEDVDRLRDMRIRAAAARLAQLAALRATGQPLGHGVNERARDKRRAKNKRARKSRRLNRTGR